MLEVLHYEIISYQWTVFVFTLKTVTQCFSCTNHAIRVKCSSSKIFTHSIPFRTNFLVVMFPEKVISQHRFKCRSKLVHPSITAQHYSIKVRKTRRKGSLKSSFYWSVFTFHSTQQQLKYFFQIQILRNLLNSNKMETRARRESRRIISTGIQNQVRNFQWSY